MDKAEGDWESLNRELWARKSPNYDSACFHAQQCAEKYLKARLQEASLAFPRTHNLLDLLALVLPVEPSWKVLYGSLDALNDYAVVFRYPGHSANREEAREARRECHAVREVIRANFRLTSELSLADGDTLSGGRTMKGDSQNRRFPTGVDAGEQTLHRAPPASGYNEA